MHTRLLSSLLLAAYSALLIKVMVFKDIPVIHIGRMMFKFGGVEAAGAPNLMPFATIIPYLLGANGELIGGVNLIGNVVLLVPVGLLLPFVIKNLNWKTSFLLAIAAGLLIEGLQVLLQVGIFDIDDVILNALGVMVGYWITVGIVQKKHS